MRHSYFRQLGADVHTLPEGERAQRAPPVRGSHIRLCSVPRADVALFRYRRLAVRVKGRAAAERLGIQELDIPGHR